MTLKMNDSNCFRECDTLDFQISKFIDDLSYFLDSVKYPKQKKSNQTIFEIIGKVDHEVILVNSLVFFLDSDNPHSFGSTIYERFCSEAGIDKDIFGDLKDIQTEVYHTFEGKSGRIDIVIETDDGIIVVEAKVNAGLKNPLDVYEDYAVKTGKKNVEHILLTKNANNTTNSWTNLTWGQIFQLEALDYDSYKLLWDSLKNSFKEDVLMEKDELKKIAEKQHEYIQMYKNMQTVFDYMKNKANTVLNQLSTLDNFSKEDGSNKNLRIWASKFGTSDSAFPVVVVEGKSKDAVIDIYVQPRGYAIVVFARKDEGQYRKLLEENGYEIKDWQNSITDEKPTKRAWISKYPEELDINLAVQEGGANNEQGPHFNGDPEELSKLIEKIWDIITKHS